jgi:hypothetical protein
MGLVVGLVLIVAAIAGLWAARPRGGKPRAFVNTRLEVPVTIAIIISFAVGVVLLIEDLAT